MKEARGPAGCVEGGIPLVGVGVAADAKALNPVP